MTATLRLKRYKRPVISKRPVVRNVATNVTFNSGYVFSRTCSGTYSPPQFNQILSRNYILWQLIVTINSEY